MIPEHEPNLVTNPELEGTLAELIELEPIFHRPRWGTTRRDFERMTREDFWEVGASGRRYSRDYIFAEVEKRFARPHEDKWEASGFQCRQLAADIYLLTYTLVQENERRTRRSTIWQRAPEGWRIIFHQGTIVQED